MTKHSRRDFVKRAGLAAAAVPMIVPSRVLGAQAPSNVITMGFIGVGLQGHNVNLKMFLEQDDCRAIAVCDVKPEARERARNTINEKYGNQDCDVTDDFRDLLARKDIDAVCISTPDHWHVPMSIMALEAGKDVISEKPTLSLQEGRELVDTVKKNRTHFHDRAGRPLAAPLSQTRGSGPKWSDRKTAHHPCRPPVQGQGLGDPSGISGARRLQLQLVAGTGAL